jgi:protein-tyrosine phosphatase
LIDLHCHALPALDDGPPTLADSLVMASAAAADGIAVLTATPHVRADYPQVRPAELAPRCDALEAAIREASIPVAVAQGAEVDAGWASDAGYDELVQVSYRGAGTDILLETPHGLLPLSFQHVLFYKLAASGFRVLLAHPERNSDFQKHPALLGDLVRQGVLLQVNAGSLLAERRSAARRLARDLVKDGLAHVIASDAHRGKGWRPPNLSAGLKAARGLNRLRADWMVEDVPAAILAGDPLPAPPQRRARGARALRRA